MIIDYVDYVVYMIYAMINELSVTANLEGSRSFSGAAGCHGRRSYLYVNPVVRWKLEDSCWLLSLLFQ